MFDRIRADRRTGLVTYVTAGDPDLPRSADILRALDRAGADVLEVGVPFSEPLADGPVIQRATERALAAGATASSVLNLVAAVRGAIKAPIVLFSYANPILRMGVDTFGDRAQAAGVDGDERLGCRRGGGRCRRAGRRRRGGRGLDGHSQDCRQRGGAQPAGDAPRHGGDHRRPSYAAQAAVKESPGRPESGRAASR